MKRKLNCEKKNDIPNVIFVTLGILFLLLLLVLGALVLKNHMLAKNNKIYTFLKSMRTLTLYVKTLMGQKSVR